MQEDPPRTGQFVRPLLRYTRKTGVYPIMAQSRITRTSIMIASPLRFMQRAAGAHDLQCRKNTKRSASIVINLRLMKSNIYTNRFKENILIYPNESRHGF